MGKSIAVSSNLLFQSDLSVSAKIGSVLPKLDSQFSFMIIFKSVNGGIFGSFSMGIEQ